MDFLLDFNAEPVGSGHYSSPDFEIPWIPLLGSMYGTLGLITCTFDCCMEAQILGRSYPSFTSLYQGSVRFNTFISMAVITGLNPVLCHTSEWQPPFSSWSEYQLVWQ